MVVLSSREAVEIHSQGGKRIVAQLPAELLGRFATQCHHDINTEFTVRLSVQVTVISDISPATYPRFTYGDSKSTLAPNRANSHYWFCKA
jgi:hypothetical protein